jgi:homocysteine S-methyltransferase
VSRRSSRSGVDCGDPLDVAEAIAIAREAADKPVIVYPNSGEGWAADRVWMDLRVPTIAASWDDAMSWG